MIKVILCCFAGLLSCRNNDPRIGYSKNLENVDCKNEITNMVLGSWENIEDSSFVVQITVDTIKYLYDNVEQDRYRLVIVNEMEDCKDALPNYPPSKLRLVEYVYEGDSLVHHILFISKSRMELASENHDIHFKRSN